MSEQPDNQDQAVDELQIRLWKRLSESASFTLVAHLVAGLAIGLHIAAGTRNIRYQFALAFPRRAPRVVASRLAQLESRRMLDSLLLPGIFKRAQTIGGTAPIDLSHCRFRWYCCACI